MKKFQNFLDRMKIETEKLKALAKDEDAFNELHKIITEKDEIIESFKSDFDDFFWIYQTRIPEKKVFISDSAEKMLGYSPTEIEKMNGNLFAIIHDDDMQKVKNSLANFETDSKADRITLTYRVQSKKQNIKWIKEAISARRDTKGKIICQTSFICDVSAIKENEEDLKTSNNNLVEINKAKDRFISIVSHDLRAPFTSLLGFSEILLNERELPEEEKSEYLKYIYDASKNQLQMINYLLEWSRLQTGRVTPEIKRLELKTLVAACTASLIGNAIRKDIEIRQDIDPGIFIQADEKLITQAVSNLISNAIKFTKKNKSITITASKYKEGFVEIVVRDEGVGISEANRDKLFKIDQKFSLQGTEGEKGSGLGLTLVKEIVERHNGDIWFYSKENEGTEFHITLPEAKNVILLVEDDKSLIGLYRKFLERELEGYQIVQSVNGYEAMSMIMNSLPTLIITDHFMPLMNGIQLIEAIRKKDKSFSVPVIVISAKLDLELRKKYEDYGVTRILDKPLDPDILINNIKELIY